MRDKTTARIGLNFAEVLGVVFIALRLCGVIDWPWVWVLASDLGADRPVAAGRADCYYRGSEKKEMIECQTGVKAMCGSEESKKT